MHIVITGVTRGLGRALAEWYISKGHVVSGCGRSGSDIFDLRFAHSEPNCFDAVDVTDSIKVEIWADRVTGQNGAPDVLINNAALITEPTPLWQVGAQDFSKLIDVNIKGVTNVIRAFAPEMLDAGKGTIVNVSSGWGRSVSAGMAAYCASKYAIEGLTKALAADLPAGLAAIPLNPGLINTDMLRKSWGADAANHPDPKAWAEVAAPFILTLNRSHNGQSLSVPKIG